MEEIAMQTSLAPSADLTPTGRPGTTTRAAADASLVSRIAQGDKAAMRALFMGHHIHVYRFMLRLVGNEALAEDLTSEVFLEVWRQSARFEGRSTVSTWMLAIGRYKALSARQRHGDVQLDEMEVEAIEDLADGPEAVVQQKDRSGTLRRCLAELSVKHREIVDLVYYHEKSVEQAATILGIPNNTVKTRMFYARRRLSDLLKEAGMRSTSM
jgi:RNA polymerase sigma-70 factor, ECF subfamily